MKLGKCPKCSLRLIAVGTSSTPKYTEKSYHHDAFPNGFRKAPCVVRCSIAVGRAKPKCEPRKYRRSGNSVR